MRTMALLILLAVAASSCSMDRGNTHQMFPDCTQASAEERAQGKCMHRPEIPDGV